jgi:hypothetical protein
MKIWDRIRVVCVLLAIAALFIGLMDGFFAIKITIFQSPVRFCLMLLLFWIAAPWIAKFVRVGKEID